MVIETNETNKKQSRFFDPILLIIILFIFLIFVKNLAFWSKSQTFIGGDTVIYSLYIASLAEKITHLSQIFSLKDSFFLWNPSYMIGIPTLSVVDIGVLYPPNIIIALIAKLTGSLINVFPLYMISLLLHLAFGGFFIFKILRKHWNLDDFSSLAGALIWTFIGFNIEFIPASSIFLAGSYLPACVYFSFNLVRNKRSRDFFLLFLLLSLSFLVGYPMVSLLITIIVFVLTIFLPENSDKKTKINSLKVLLIGLFLITIPIISPLYFSSFINFSYSYRTTLSADGFVLYPAQFSDLIESVVPKNTPFNNLNNRFPNYLYLSLVGIILLLQTKNKKEILTERKNRLLLFIGILGLIFCLGKVTSIPTISYFFLPGINLFRRLSVFSIIPGFVFCLFSGLAFKSALEEKKHSKIVYLIIGGFIILGLFQLISIALSGQKEPIINFTAIQQTIGTPILILVFLFLAFSLFNFSPRMGIYLVIFTLLLEAGTVVSSKFFINSKQNFIKIFVSNILTKNLQNLVKPSERVELTGSQNSYNTDFLNLEQTAGYLSLASKYGVSITEAFTNNLYNSKNLRDILGAKYLVRKIVPPEPSLEKIIVMTQNEREPDFFYFSFISLQWEPELNNTQFAIYINHSALKRVYLASEIKPFDQTEKILNEIEKLQDPKNVFIKNEDIKGNVSKEGEAEILEYKRNYLKASVKAGGQTFLANSTAYYPGWKVKINGHKTNLIQTNWFMFGVFVPPGENIIEFYYVPYGINAGIIYIITSLAIWVAFKKKLLSVI